MKIYCYQCGAANQYTTEKPNFCMKCGNALTATKASLNSEKVTEPLAAETEPETDTEEINSVPSIDELQVDINASAGLKMNFGDVMGTKNGSANANDEGFVAPDQQAKSKEQFLEDFKKEAGETRRRPKK